ncbi:hypothetical protein F4859DRAFT_514389 [Xylaria cf. heliscus]|nr:hypothetical protein F4859DRAFT_514389 [Xylaria cf. heliscus]
MSSQDIEDGVAEVEQLFDSLTQGYVDEIKRKIDQFSSQKRQLEEQTAKLKDNTDRFDVSEWRMAVESYNQARFDNALHWLIAMEKDETLDRLRKMSPDHKAAILDLERQITVVKLNKAEC